MIPALARMFYICVRMTLRHRLFFADEWLQNRFNADLRHDMLLNERYAWRMTIRTMAGLGFAP